MSMIKFQCSACSKTLSMAFYEWSEGDTNGQVCYCRDCFNKRTPKPEEEIAALKKYITILETKLGYA